MRVKQELSYSQGLKDQSANHIAADRIVKEEDVSSINDLVELVKGSYPRRLRMDATLTLAYVAEANPKLVDPHFKSLIGNLKDKVDRVAWGSMIALAHIVNLAPQKFYDELPSILEAMENLSVVGRDHGFKILVEVYKDDRFKDDVFPLLCEQLSMAPANQLGQYTERLISEISVDHMVALRDLLESKREDLDNPHHIKRLDKNLMKLHKKLSE